MSLLEFVLLCYILPSLCFMLIISYLMMYTRSKTFRESLDLSTVLISLVLPVGIIVTTLLIVVAIGKLLKQCEGLEEIIFKEISLKHELHKGSK